MKIYVLYQDSAEYSDSNKEFIVASRDYERIQAKIDELCTPYDIVKKMRTDYQNTKDRKVLEAAEKWVDEQPDSVFCREIITGNRYLIEDLIGRFGQQGRDLLEKTRTWFRTNTQPYYNTTSYFSFLDTNKFTSPMPSFKWENIYDKFPDPAVCYYRSDMTVAEVEEI